MTFSLSAVKEAVTARFQRNKRRTAALEAEVAKLKTDVATQKKATEYEKALTDIKAMAEDDLEKADDTPDPADAPDAQAGDAAEGVSRETDPEVMAVATPDVA